MKILCIAPYAPPLNHAEPIQVFRIVQELLRSAEVDLVSEPVFGAWSQADPAFALEAPGLRRFEVALPAHALAMRVIDNRRLRGLAPVLDRWVTARAGAVARWAGEFDILYTRSLPTRAALLGRALKQATGKPWVLHLSDPWAEAAEGRLARALAEADERDCFAAADRIMLTTTVQADKWRRKYPAMASKFRVSPNMLPAGAVRSATRFRGAGTIELLSAGALYGNRSAIPLIEAIAALPEGLRARVRLTIAGNAIDREVAAMRSAGDNFRYLGLVDYCAVLNLQQRADVLVTIEPPNLDGREGQYLLSKLLDYLPTGKPILAITPPGSVTERLVRGDYGWAVDPAAPVEIGALLRRILTGAEAGAIAAFRNDLPSEYRAETVAQRLLADMKELA